MAAIEDVDHQAEYEPDDEAKPRDQGETQHEAAAQNYRDDREQRNEWNAEGTLAIRLTASEKNYAQRD